MARAMEGDGERLPCSQRAPGDEARRAKWAGPHLSEPIARGLHVHLYRSVAANGVVASAPGEGRVELRFGRERRTHWRLPPLRALGGPSAGSRDDETSDCRPA